MMRFRLADPASPNYLNIEAFLNNLKLIPINGSTELVLGVAPVDEDGNQMASGLTIPVWDYVSMTLSGGDTTETYTFKTGGSSGTTVATVVVVYTDSSRETLSSVTKT